MGNTVQEQSKELATQLWNIANEFRGNMDASEFKNYILGLIFYRYLSERTEDYMDDLLKDDNEKSERINFVKGNLLGKRPERMQIVFKSQSRKIYQN